MLENSTLIVLGAGAHAPYFLPTSNELLEYIQNRFPNYIQRLLTTSPEIVYSATKLIDEFCKQIEHIGFSTIDRWIASNRQFEFLAKAAIAYALIEILENPVDNSKRNHRNPRIYKNTERGGDWFRVFFEQLTRDIITVSDLERLLSSNIKFVTFNYEHFFEYLFFLRLNSSYSDLISDVSYKELRNKVYHKFLPTHINGALKMNTRFNVRKPEEPLYTYFSYSDLQYISSGIYTLGTEVESNNRINPYEYENIFFLGFGYDDENLKRLGFLESAPPYQGKIYGTAFNMKEEKITLIKQRLSILIGQKRIKDNKIIIENKDSYQLLSDYLTL